MGARWPQAVVVLAAMSLPGLGAGQDSPSPALRIEIGYGAASRGDCEVDWIDTCDWSSFSGSSLVVLDVIHDNPIGSTPNLSAGGRILYWKEGGDVHFEFEPTLGVTWKFPLAAWMEARLHAGGGLYLGTELGLALRLGAGVGVALSPAVSLGLDGMLEAGLLGGELFSTSTIAIGPAIRL